MVVVVRRSAVALGALVAGAGAFASRDEDDVVVVAVFVVARGAVVRVGRATGPPTRASSTTGSASVDSMAVSDEGVGSSSTALDVGDVGDAAAVVTVSRSAGERSVPPASGATRASTISLPTNRIAWVASAVATTVVDSHVAMRVERRRTRPSLASGNLRGCQAFCKGPEKRHRIGSPVAYLEAMAAIYLVEDDQRIRASLARALAERGHSVRAGATAMDGLKDIVAWKPDVVVLDLGLPDIDGEKLLSMLRAVSSVPVVVSSARDDEASVIKLLDAGADDYVVKPYSADHLDARLRAVLRRVTVAASAEPLVVGPLELAPNRREAKLDGVALDLTRKEYDLLLFLAQRAGEVVTKREMLAEVWRQPYGGTDKTVDVHLSWLRRKLGETGAAPRMLHTVRGVGVKLAPED